MCQFVLCLLKKRRRRNRQADLTINPVPVVFVIALGMACHQINPPPMTSTSIRNISPGMQITQCATTVCTQNGDELCFLSSPGVLYSHVTDHEEGVCS